MCVFKTKLFSKSFEFILLTLFLKQYLVIIKKIYLYFLNFSFFNIYIYV